VEPLDLLDALTGVLRARPGHWLDRLVSPPGGPARLCARRLFVKLPRGNAFDPAWIRAAEETLAAQYH